jgi:hypothetical protein
VQFCYRTSFVGGFPKYTIKPAVRLAGKPPDKFGSTLTSHLAIPVPCNKKATMNLP